MAAPFNLQRFLDAQEPVIDSVRRELSTGRKTSHWMWFIFPQLAGLGSSEMAREYAISGLEEARAYLDHPVLCARLTECTNLVNAVQGRSIDQILGYPDNLKFRSSMTLFSIADPDKPEFREALRKYFGGEPDPLTVRALSTAP